MTAYTKFRTQLGTVAIGFTERGISRVALPSADWTDLSRADLQRLGFRDQPTPPREIAEVARALQDHVAGKAQDFSGVRLDVDGAPPFLLRVQRAAQAIRPGQTRSYADLAAAAGSPNAARAAGRAMSTNPWPIIVPCHRVLPRSGFGAYSAGSGVHTKLRLLWREGYRGRTSNVGFDEHAAVEHLKNADALLGAMIDKVGPFTLQAAAPGSRGGDEPFTALAKAIVSQQLSGKAAATIYARVAGALGCDTVDDANAVLALPKARLRAAGLSENKALSLRDLAQHAQSGSLPSRTDMQSLTDEQIVEALSTIRGIGRWSAQMLLLFYLGRPNVLPVADLGVQKGFAVTYGLRSLPSASVMQRTAQAWAPYASVASWYMWRAVEVARYSGTETAASGGAAV
jgi:methylated-DNA-[protein]-cysteine S-methyltransferase